MHVGQQDRPLSSACKKQSDPTSSYVGPSKNKNRLVCRRFPAARPDTLPTVTTLSKKERMRRALWREPVDHLPVQTNFTGAMGAKLAGYFQTPVEELEARLGNHLLRVDLAYVPRLSPDGQVRFDWWGAGWGTETEGYWPAVAPLAESRELGACSWPDPNAPGLLAEAELALARDRGQHFVVPNFGFALFERAWSLRGFDQLLIDLVEHPAWVEELLDRITDIQVRLARRFLAMQGGSLEENPSPQKGRHEAHQPQCPLSPTLSPDGGEGEEPAVHGKAASAHPGMASLTSDLDPSFPAPAGAKGVGSLAVDGGYFGDDYGAQHGLLFSPKLWRRMIKPRLARMFAVFREAGLPVLLHSDGDIWPILPDLVDIGLTCLNPVQPEVLEHGRLYREFGKHLSFYGGISTQEVLPKAGPAEVRAATQACMRDLAPDGTGLVLGPSHRMQSDIPLENVAAMLEAFPEFTV